MRQQMKIKGDTVKDNKRLLSGRLYRIDISRTIVFEEKDTDDVVHPTRSASAYALHSLSPFPDKSAFSESSPEFYHAAGIW